MGGQERTLSCHWTSRLLIDTRHHLSSNFYMCLDCQSAPRASHRICRPPAMGRHPLTGTFAYLAKTVGLLVPSNGDCQCSEAGPAAEHVRINPTKCPPGQWNSPLFWDHASQAENDRLQPSAQLPSSSIGGGGLGNAPPCSRCWIKAADAATIVTKPQLWNCRSCTFSTLSCHRPALIHCFRALGNPVKDTQQLCPTLPYPRR